MNKNTSCKSTAVLSIESQEMEWIQYGFGLLNVEPTMEMLGEVIDAFSDIYTENPGWEELANALAVLLTDQAERMSKDKPEDKEAAIKMLDRAIKYASKMDKTENDRRNEIKRKIENDMWRQRYGWPSEIRPEGSRIQEAMGWVQSHIEPTNTYQTVLSQFMPPKEILDNYLSKIAAQILNYKQSGRIPVVQIKDCPTKMLSWIKKILADCGEMNSKTVLVDELEESRTWICTWCDRDGEELRNMIEEFFKASATTVEEVNVIRWQLSHGCFVLHNSDWIPLLKESLTMVRD